MAENKKGDNEGKISVGNGLLLKQLELVSTRSVV